MTDIRKVVENRLTGQRLENGSLSDMKKTTEDIKAVDETLDAARKLAGTSGLESELVRKEKKLDDLQKENRAMEMQLNHSYMDSVKTEIGSKIARLEDSLKGGANSSSLKEQVQGIKEAMTVFEGSRKVGDEVDTLSKLMHVVKEMRGDQNNRSLATQVQEAKQALDLLKPEQQGSMQGMPASIALQIAQLNSNVQMQLETMRDERDRRDKSFQLEVMKFQDERDLRRKEIESKIQIEQDRNQFLADGIEKLGGVIAEAAAERGEGGIQRENRPQRQRLSGVIEAGEGEFGEVQCRKCGTKISIAADAVQSMCSKCSGVYSIERVARAENPGQETSKGQEMPKAEVEEMDETWQRGVR